MPQDVDEFDRPFNIHDDAQLEGHVKKGLYWTSTNRAVEILYYESNVYWTVHHCNS